jgi:hypothetical protein
VRVDGDWKGAHFIAYNEFDFLGTSGGNNLGITNGAFVPRLRLFWVDVTKDKWEFLAGQTCDRTFRLRQIDLSAESQPC